MKAYLINMHLLVPRSRPSAKVRVKYKGYISQKMAVSGAFMFRKHIFFFFFFCLKVKMLSDGLMNRKECCMQQVFLSLSEGCTGDQPSLTWNIHTENNVIRTNTLSQTDYTA